MTIKDQVDLELTVKMEATPQATIHEVEDIVTLVEDSITITTIVVKSQGYEIIKLFFIPYFVRTNYKIAFKLKNLLI